VTSDGAALDPRRMLYLATLAGAEAMGLEQEIGSLCPGKAADFVFVRPPLDSVLAAVLTRASDVDEMLGAVFALAGAVSVLDVRVDGAQVHVA
jgi:guanine deaminase